MSQLDKKKLSLANDCCEGFDSQEKKRTEEGLQKLVMQKLKNDNDKVEGKMSNLSRVGEGKQVKKGCSVPFPFRYPGVSFPTVPRNASRRCTCRIVAMAKQDKNKIKTKNK